MKTMVVWLLRLFSISAIAVVALPYVKGNDTGVSARLYELMTRFSFVPEHRLLAPVLVLWCALYVLATILPHSRGLLTAAIIVSGFWALFMVLIPLGFAHVRPLYGYWISQGLILLSIVAMGMSLR